MARATEKVDRGGMNRRRPHLLAVVAVFVSTVVSGSVEAAPQPSQVRVSYQTTASRLPRMCVGEDSTFEAGVDRLVVSPLTPVLENHSAAQPQRDVVIEATSADERIATVADGVQIVGLDGSQPPVARFRVHGERDGTTQIKLHAKINAMAETDLWQGDTRDQYIDVTVVVTNCRFTLDTVSRWAIPGEADLKFGAAIDAAVLEPDKDGVYDTSAKMTWYLVASAVGDCTGTLTAPPSEATIHAKLDGSGLLDVDIRFGPANITYTNTCRGVGGTMSQTEQPETLVFSAPTAGGSGGPQHALSGQAGQTRWIVTPMAAE